MSIRWKLGIIFLVISLVPLAIFSVIGIDRSRQILRHEIGLNFELIARDKAMVIASVLNRRVKEAVSLATNPRVIAAVVDANSSYAGEDDDFAVREIKRIDRAWLQSKGGMPVARNILGSGISIFLRDYVGRDPLEYGEIFITDRLGATVAMTSTLTDYYQADEGWWREGFAGGKGAVYIDDRGLDLSVNAVVTGVIVPVRVGGEVAGLLKINFKMAHIPAIITNPFEGGDVSVFMHRSNGTAVIASSDGLHEAANETETRIMAERVETGWTEDEHDLEPTIMGYALVQPERMIYSRFQEKKSRKGVAGENWGRTDWYVFVKRGRATAYAPLTKLMTVFILGGAVIAVVVVIMAGVAATTVTNPLLQLREGMETIAAGNLDLKIGGDRMDEIGDVLRGIDRMVRRLKETLASRDELNQEISEREKTEEALRKAKAELEGANKELEAFSYSVSHDLRAPLRSMDGFSHALLEDHGDKLDAEGKDYLQRVRAASQKMAQLIDDLLKLSRVTRGEFERREVDMSELAQTVAVELQESAPERRVTLDIAPGVTAEGDARLIRIVLENLLGNAWKFTAKHDHSTIEFGVANHDGEPAYFVRDDGAGFDMAYADKLFQPFQRLHSGAEFGGTGIGLATVARIVQRHGGRVWAESGVEQGTTVYFTL